MTYCVGIRLDAGLVFLSDSRTNAGLDQISTFRKMMIYEKAGRPLHGHAVGRQPEHQPERARDPAGREAGQRHREPLTIWNAPSMFDATRVLGARCAASTSRTARR
jgi:putative proteasome-type protease